MWMLSKALVRLDSRHGISHLHCLRLHFCPAKKPSSTAVLVQGSDSWPDAAHGSLPAFLPSLQTYKLPGSTSSSAKKDCFHVSSSCHSMTQELGCSNKLRRLVHMRALSRVAKIWCLSLRRQHAVANKVHNLSKL